MLTEVGRMRIGIFPTGKRLVFQRLLGSDYANSCPVCNKNNPENLEHLFFACPAWNNSRSQMLEPCFPEWENMIKSSRAMTLALGVLLGGERGTGEQPSAGMSDLNGHSSVDYAMSAAIKEPMDMVLVAARFLADIIPIRRGILGQRLKNPRRTSSWNQGQRGTVALAEP